MRGAAALPLSKTLVVYCMQVKIEQGDFIRCNPGNTRIGTIKTWRSSLLDVRNR